MEVEVVLSQVGEDAASEVNPLGAAELERMRGHLHRAGRVARVEHPLERRLEVDALGRRALDRLLNAADDRLDRAQQAGLHARPLEDRAREERGRRLPVRAGDADDPQLRRRVAVEARRSRAHRGAHARHDQLGHAELQRTLADECGGAALDRIGSEVVAIGLESGHAEEEPSGPDVRAAVVQAGYLHVGRISAHQLAESHASQATCEG
jgi:hypothetical protein